MKVIMQMIGRMLCRIGWHDWKKAGRSEGLGLIQYYGCSRCAATGESHVADEGDIHEYER